MQVLIVEDEIAAGDRLEQLLREVRPHYEILAKVDTIGSCIQYLRSRSSPELMFLDIQLGDGLSFSIFSQVEVNCPVIFTTAYDNYALRAFKVNSIDYLLKPIDKEELIKAIEKYEKLNFQTLHLSEQVVAKLVSSVQSKYRDRFLVKQGKLLRYLSTADVTLFYSEDGLTFVRDLQGQRFLVDGTVDAISSLVDPHVFFRINRKALVHLQGIQVIHPYFNSRLRIEMDPPAPFDLIVARDRVGSFKQWLEGDSGERKKLLD